MQPKKRKAEIRQRQKRRAKGVSFRQINHAEHKSIAQQREAAVKKTWKFLDERSLTEIQSEHHVSFKSLIEKLRARFPGEALNVLNEGSGRDKLKQALKGKEFGGGIDVMNTDIRQGEGWPDKVVGVMGIEKEFGRKQFHLVVSTFGGGTYSPMHEKAFFQLVSVLKPGGIGVAKTRISEKRVLELAKRLNLKVMRIHRPLFGPVLSVTFTKNISKPKRRRKR